MEGTVSARAGWMDGNAELDFPSSPLGAQRDWDTPEVGQDALMVGSSMLVS